VGFMPTYETALLIAVVAGFGSAAFHPQGASGANVAAGDRKQAGVAMFMVGGNTGYAVGPLLAGFILGVFGPRGTAVLAVIGLIITPVLYVLTDPKYVPITAPKDRKQANWKIQLNPGFSTVAVLALIGVMSLRATSQSSFTSFVPQYFTIVGGFSHQEAGTLSFLMLGALAASGLTGVYAYRDLVKNLRSRADELLDPDRHGPSLAYLWDGDGQHTIAIDDTEALISKNRIWIDRTVGVAAISGEEAINWGWTGQCLRESGVWLDRRRAAP